MYKETWKETGDLEKKEEIFVVVVVLNKVVYKSTNMIFKTFITIIMIIIMLIIIFKANIHVHARLDADALVCV